MTGKQIGIGAFVLLLLSGTAGAVADLEKLGLDHLLPVSRGALEQVAENLSSEQKEQNRRWIDLYYEQLFETELKQQEHIQKFGAEPSTQEIFESQKRRLKNQIKTLEKKDPE